MKTNIAQRLAVLALSMMFATGTSSGSSFQDPSDVATKTAVSNTGSFTTSFVETDFAMTKFTGEPSADGTADDTTSTVTKRTPRMFFSDTFTNEKSSGTGFVVTKFFDTCSTVTQFYGQSSTTRVGATV